MDRLFLLSPGFEDPARPLAGATYLCPECTLIEGVLHHYPQLRDTLMVTYVGFAKPRPQLVTLLGEGHQGCPVLILDGVPSVPFEGARQYGGLWFIDDPHAIADYWAITHGIAYLH